MCVYRSAPQDFLKRALTLELVIHPRKQGFYIDKLSVDLRRCKFASTRSRYYKPTSTADHNTFSQRKTQCLSSRRTYRIKRGTIIETYKHTRLLKNVLHP